MKNSKVDICFKDGKYIVDATIHTEIETNDIAEVQEHFNVDCANSFSKTLKEYIGWGYAMTKSLDEHLLKNYDYKFFEK